MSSNVERLVGLLGFDPANAAAPGANALSKAMEEIRIEEEAQKQKKAKELILEAVRIRTEMQAAERAFNSQLRQFDKNLGKVMSKIESLSGGKPPEEDKEEESPAE